MQDENSYVLNRLYDKYEKICDYFDDWIVIKTDPGCKEIEQIVMRKNVEPHIETCEW